MNLEIAIGIVVVFLLVSLVILFCGILIKLYIHKIKKYTQVIYEKDIAFQKTLNTTILETQEQVLKNISQDLHDDAGQQLTYINFQLEHLKLDAPELQKQLEPVSDSVVQLSKSIRGISHSLNTHLLRQHDLIKAIASEVTRMQNNSSFTIDFKVVEDAKKTFTTQEQIVIYRIFQEILNNILKHAKASQINITLTTTPFFSLTVQDNGKGFDVAALPKSTLGLHTMIDRAALIAYHLKFESALNQGTTFTLTENTTP